MKPELEVSNINRNGHLSGVSKWMFLALVVTQAGCFVPISYDTSVPREIPTGYSGKINNETITLEFPELTLSAQIQAYDWDGQYLLRPLGVWIEIDSPDGWFTLDPGLVTLQSDAGDEMESVSFLGPDLPWHSPRALAAGCGPRRFHSGIAITNIGISQSAVIRADNEYGIFRPTRGPVVSEGTKCFMFWFDTDPMPDHAFVLSIDGLSVDGKQIPVPKLHYQVKSLTSWRGIP